jgi:sugar O-acyltransferase (sialic acid O-acetyltransferase NeuD family)
VTRKLVVLGAGGHGREVLDVFEAVTAVTARPTHHFAGFLDDGEPSPTLLAKRDVPVLGPVSLLATLDADYLVGTGTMAARRRLSCVGLSAGRRAPVLVHPAASVGSCVDCAEGVVIAAGARVTTNVSLGAHVYLNVNATVSHDCVLGARVIANPGAIVCGNVNVGDDVMLGAGCVIREGVRIGAEATVGAGAVVVHDVEPGTTVVGVPARPMIRTVGEREA